MAPFREICSIKAQLFYKLTNETARLTAARCWRDPKGSLKNTCSSGQHLDDNRRTCFAI